MASDRTTTEDLASAEDRLSSFLAKYEPAIEADAREVRAKLRRLLPGAVEIVYDNYNALVIGYGPTERPSEAILSIAVMPRWVTLCFLQGARLPDPHGLLRGGGNQVRNVRLSSPSEVDSPPVRELIRLAVSAATPPVDPARPHALVIRSISTRQRPRRPRA